MASIRIHTHSAERRVYPTETFTNRTFVIESRDGLGRTKQEPESRAYKDVLAACLRRRYP